MRDLIIIGAGASGLAIASYLALHNNNIDVLVIEKKDKVGSKVLASGNGRCNITNLRCRGFEKTKEFFDQLSIEIEADSEGRCYPRSNKAKDVVAALSYCFYEKNISLSLSETVEQVSYDEGVFTLKTNKGSHQSKKLVIATGGKSSPMFGSSGDGFVFAKKLGHRVNKLSPVLTTIDAKVSKSLNGVRAKANVVLNKKGAKVFEEPGEVQFTKEGVSGICIFNSTRFLKLDSETKFEDYTLKLDFCPDMDMDQLVNTIVKRIKAGRLKPMDILLTLVNDNLAKTVLGEVFDGWGKAFGEGFDDKNLEMAKVLGPEEVLSLGREIACKLKSYELIVGGAGGWKNAQATSGGVSLDEINIENAMSKLVPGLYFAGEVVDFDGPCGGFNLQNCWDMAMKVGGSLCIEYTR